MMFYDKIKKGVVFEPSESTIEWEDPSLAKYREYSSNLYDKSYQCDFDADGMPVINRYALDDSGNRYSIYLETPDANGFYQPDPDAIAIAQAESNKIEAISNLESQITQRNLRSAMLGDQWAIDHITNIEAQIAALRPNA